MSVGRRSDQPGGNAVGVLNLDSTPPEDAVKAVAALNAVHDVRVIQLPAAGELPSWLQ
jgi:D-3-phosphoglycerate dehydrogenase